MGSQQNKDKDAKASSAYLKKRAEHRAKLVEDMVIGIEDDAYVDSAIGLLNGQIMWETGLTFYINKWSVLPPVNQPEYIRLEIDKGTGQWEQLGEEKEFRIPSGQTDFPDEFPNPIFFLGKDLPLDATCRLRYVHRSYQFVETESQITVLTFDQIAPWNRLPPEKLAFESADAYLDDTNLPAGGTLTIILPGNPGWRSDDELAIYVVDSDDPPDDPTTTTPVFAGFAPSPGITDSTVAVAANKIRAFGDAKVLFTYAFRDRALNLSAPALYKEVSLTFGPLPTTLTKPEVPQALPVLTMEKVREGVSVWIKKYLNHKGQDDIRLTWGSKTLELFSTGNNPPDEFEIPVKPDVLMLEDYGQATTGNKTTTVSYEVIRQGRIFGPESDDFQVNFATAIVWPDPWPPVDWPNPIHPDLLEGEVKSFDGLRTNTLTRADKDKTATFHFTWYDLVVNGHVLNFFWKGERIVEAETTFDDTQPGHAPGLAYSVDVPWVYIQRGGNSQTVPVHYELSGALPGNELRSATTVVDVNAIAVEMPKGDFPTFASQPNPDYPACGALEADGALKVGIPDLTGVLNAGDTIRVKVTPMRGDDLSAPEDPITAAIFEKDFTLGQSESPLIGFVFLVEPYATYIKPLYDENEPTQRRGRIKVQYFYDDGTEVVPSEPHTAVTAFHRPNAPCF